MKSTLTRSKSILLALSIYKVGKFFFMTPFPFFVQTNKSPVKKLGRCHADDDLYCLLSGEV